MRCLWRASVRFIDEVSQLYMVRRLLVDDSAEDSLRIIDCVYSELDVADQALLEDLENRLQGVGAQPP